MTGFTGSTIIPVFDLLTVIVMIEQCEPDLTVVTWISPWGQSTQGNWIDGHYIPAMRETTCCMACLLRTTERSRAGDGRGALVAAVREGNLHVLSIGPRSDTWKCPRCQTHLIPRR